jgi:hypothetical protein
MSRSSGFLGICLAALASAVVAQPTTKELKVPGGIIKVSITLASPAALGGPKRSPRIGVAGASILGAPLARKLDETGSVQVVSPSKFSMDIASFDTVTKAEFAETLASACRRAKVDYALYMAQPQMTTGASPTTYLFGFGRIHQTNTFKIRLYDCQSGQPSWDASVAVDGSSGIWTNMFMGKTAAGGGESQDAAAQMIAAKIVADMGFLAGPTPAVTAAQTPPPSALVADVPAAASGTLVMERPGHLYRGPSSKSSVEKTLVSGALLYPTGQHQGVWEEVTDEEGAKGWVSSQLATTFQGGGH